MTNDTLEPDMARIRQFLLAAFTPEEFRRSFAPRFYGFLILCFDP